MRIVKEADVRKNEIMDAATKLFHEKGYDKTSTNDILEAVGIARGTLYHHFKSKESIMDALINRQTESLIAAAQAVAKDKSLSVEERMIRTIMAMNVSEQDESDNSIMTHLHQPQNALMHQKINSTLMHMIPPILAEILQDGIDQGLFQTPYPLACMEMVVVYLQAISDTDVFQFGPSEYAQRLEALSYHLERILGVAPGRFAFIMQLF